MELNSYDVEMSEIREKIDEIDSNIIKFIIAISQKIEATISGSLIKFSIKSFDRREEEVNYTLIDLEEKDLYESYESIIFSKIYEILMPKNEDNVDKNLKKWLFNLISRRFQESYKVAEIKGKSGKKILDIERRDKMVLDRGEKWKNYILETELRNIFRYIHDKSCELQGFYFRSKDKNFDTNKLYKELKGN